MYQKVGRFLESDENEANLTLEELNDELFQYHIPAIVFVIISMVVGVFGNTLVILIYKTKFRRSNHRYFILFLAVTDFVACVTGMPFLVASLRLPYLMTSSVTCKTLRYFHYFVNNCSGLLLVVIAIERFRKIVRPFKRQLTTRQTLYLCYGTMFISAIMAVPAPIFFDATDIDTGVQNITGKQCYVSPSSKKGFERFNFILMLEAFASMVIFAVLYSLIVRKLCTSDQFVQAMKSMRSVSSMDSGRKGINSLEDHSVDIMDTETPTHSEISQEPSVKGAVSLKSSTQTEYTSNDNGTTQSTVSLNTDVESRNNDHVTGRNARALWRKSVDLIGRNSHNEKQNVVTRAQSDVRLNRIRQPKTSNTRSHVEPLEVLIRKKRSQVKRASKHKSSKTTIHVTVMLFTVSIFFAIAFIPHLALMIITVHDKKFLNILDKKETMAYHLFLRSFIINNIVNPFIYLLCDSQFKKEAKLLLCRSCLSSR